jgi:DNA adenine methylase
MKKIQKGLLKWAGGKERELNALKLDFPKTIDRYFEPFVGGGSVYMNVQANKYFINDFYTELTEFYKLGLKDSLELKKYLLLLDDVWFATTNIFSSYADVLKNITRTRDLKYLESQLSLISETFMNYFIKFRYFILLDSGVNFQKEFEKNVKKKIQRIIKHEQTKGKLNDKDLYENLKTSFKSAIYTHIRAIYNLYRKNNKVKEPFFVACFFFIRNYCYSSMFRYNSKNEFNVPYGGISYNENYMNKKIEYLYSSLHQEKYKHTNVENTDFEIFLEKYKFSQGDFIFLDPPYDTEFSDYAGNSFSQEDQRRLARFLKNTTAKFLLVIKRTEFIEKLYNDNHFTIKIFEKTYQVSFKNRNNRNAEHLVITNF